MRRAPTGLRGTASSTAAVIRRGGVRVHFGHLVAIHEGRGRDKHICVGDGSGHGLVAAIKPTGDAADHTALQ